MINEIYFKKSYYINYKNISNIDYALANFDLFKKVDINHQVSDNAATWDQFHAQYQFIVPYRKKRQPLPRPPQRAWPSAEVEAFAKSHAAKKIQRLWKKVRTDRTHLVRVNPGNIHPRLLIYFLNQDNIQTPILKSLNKSGLGNLSAALELGQYQDLIFLSDHLPYLAVALYMRGSITDQQLFTLLNLHQVQNIDRYRIEGFHPALDNTGEFHPTFISFLCAYNSIFNNLHARNKLKQFILQLPDSEQFFYLTSHHDNESQLGKTLIDTLAIYQHANKIVHLCAGLEDAVNLVIYGLAYTRVIPRLGKQRLEDVEYAVRRNVRPGAIYYPHIKPFDVIHGYTSLLFTEATRHDHHHSRVKSILLEHTSKALLRLVDVTRAVTGFQWTREIWDWIDCDYRYGVVIRGVGNIFSPNATHFFCTMLLIGNRTRSSEYDCGGYLVTLEQPKFKKTVSLSSLFHIDKSASQSNYHLTALGALFILDLLYRPDKWAEIDIHANKLIYPFQNFYEVARDNKDKLDIVLDMKAKISLLLLAVANISITTAMLKMLNEPCLLNALQFTKNPKEIGADAIREDQTNCVALQLETLTLSHKELSKLSNHLTKYSSKFFMSPKTNSPDKVDQPTKKNSLINTLLCQPSTYLTFFNKERITLEVKKEYFFKTLNLCQ